MTHPFQNQPPTVLIVDDDFDVGDSLRKLLRALGMDADFIYDPTRVLEHLKERHYDVMLLDLKMPGISGIDLLPRVRAVSPVTRVIVLSGTDETQAEADALSLGAVNFLQKPIRAKLLSESIRQALTFNDS